MKGYMHKIAYVDLGAPSVKVVQPAEETLREFIGGSGLAAKMLWDEKAYRVQPLAGGNPLIFMTGPFANTPALTSGRHAVVARSPLTGIFAESDAGGTWGASLKRAGFDGMVIVGESDRPVYLWVYDGRVEIRDAAHVWGKDTFATDEALRAETTDRAVSACIGPAGEKLVRLAAILNDGRAARAAGRCGLGAVMGAKKLKAITVYGKQETELADRKGLLRSLQQLASGIKKNLAGMTKFGTAGNVSSFERLGSLPLQNWKGSQRWEQEALQINGAAMAERFGTGTYGCEGCVVRCGREVRLHSSTYGDIEGAGPEYETLASLGSLCLVSDLEAVIAGNDLCNRYGVDTISAGALVAFAMEAFERGLISSKDTGGLELTWGNGRAMVAVLEMICENRGLGEILAKGVRQAAAIIGGEAEEFAVHGNGLELPMHDPRAYGSLALSYATSARGACHLASLSHAFERALTLPEIGLAELPDRLDPTDKGKLAATGQNVMGMLDSLKVCKFMLFGGLNLTHMLDWYEKIVGETMTLATFMLTGERIFNLKRLFNLGCGLEPSTADNISRRILELPKQAEGWETRLPAMEQLREDYYKHRGWNGQGIPTREKLQELGLEKEGGAVGVN
ncbi:MAG: aldehyde ferredoxin oxidoreductase family protein [Deltaproteobacteria bacterium]|nr:aldehyde ferredoxin oxidoreductase family protein [Deltaproteobacteria bacterium]MBW2071297.1 aldehyde ferredoxin oxidoreductase family protein [Deltaproteobacteria bacterium]